MGWFLGAISTLDAGDPLVFRGCCRAWGAQGYMRNVWNHRVRGDCGGTPAGCNLRTGPNGADSRQMGKAPLCPIGEASATHRAPISIL